MIASREEFLLLVQNWKNSSASVLFLIVLGDFNSTPPASPLVVRLKGKVVGIDEATSVMVLLAGQDGIVSFGFENATFDFGTVLDLPPASTVLFATNEELDAMVTIRQSSGPPISLLALKQ